MDEQEKKEKREQEEREKAKEAKKHCTPSIIPNLYNKIPMYRL